MIEPVIDAHHNIWRLDRTPWLQARRCRGSSVPRAVAARLRIAEYMADIRDSGVVRSVFVQVNVAPGGEVDEVAGAVGRRSRGLPARRDGLRRPVGARRRRRPRPRWRSRTRAVRQQIHWHENPLYRFAPCPDVMNDPAWRRGLREVERRGLLFELQVFAGQMADAAALVRDFPDTTFVLLHAGMLADRSEAGWALWRTGMAALAGCPNVAVKLSGLGTFDRACREDRWRPVIAERSIASAPTISSAAIFPIEAVDGLCDAGRDRPPVPDHLPAGDRRAGTTPPGGSIGCTASGNGRTR
jgi:predicted TIM-barrel fold metal-dependent hydrolase